MKSKRLFLLIVTPCFLLILLISIILFNNGLKCTKFYIYNQKPHCGVLKTFSTEKVTLFAVNGIIRKIYTKQDNVYIDFHTLTYQDKPIVIPVLLGKTTDKASLIVTSNPNFIQGEYSTEIFFVSQIISKLKPNNEYIVYFQKIIRPTETFTMSKIQKSRYQWLQPYLKNNSDFFDNNNKANYPLFSSQIAILE